MRRRRINAFFLAGIAIVLDVVNLFVMFGRNCIFKFDEDDSPIKKTIIFLKVYIYEKLNELIIKNETTIYSHHFERLKKV